MKRFLLFCIGLLLLVSCKNKTNQVKEVAYRYSYAMANYNVDDAEPYATLETKQTSLQAARNLIGKVGKAYIDSDTPAQIEIVNTTIINDTEAFAIYHKTTPIKNFHDTVFLRKRDNLWQVHAPLPIARKHTQEDLDHIKDELASKSNLKEFKISKTLNLPKKSKTDIITNQ